MKIIINSIKNIAILSLGEFISRILNFISFAYLARVLCVSDFGIIGFGTALINFLLNFVNFGLDRISLRDLSKNKNLATHYIINIGMIRVVLSFLSFFIYLILLFYNSNLHLPLILLGLSIFSTGLSLNYFARSMEFFKIISINQILASIFTISLYLIFVKSNSDFIYAILIIVIVSLFTNILFLYNFKNYLKNIKNHISITLIKSLITSSFPLFLSSIMVAIYYFADTIMLGFFKSEYEVGIYSAANKIFLLLVIPYSIIVNVFLPSISKIDNNLNKNIRIYYFYMVLLALTLGLTTYLFSTNIIFWVFGSNFNLSAIPLKILALNAIIVGINMSFGEPITVWGKQKQYLVAVSVGAITNIFLNIIFIPKYSYIGAAFTTLLSEFSVFIILSYIFYNTREMHEKQQTN